MRRTVWRRAAPPPGRATPAALSRCNSVGAISVPARGEEAHRLPAVFTPSSGTKDSPSRSSLWHHQRSIATTLRRRRAPAHPRSPSEDAGQLRLASAPTVASGRSAQGGRSERNSTRPAAVRCASWRSPAAATSACTRPPCWPNWRSASASRSGRLRPHPGTSVGAIPRSAMAFESDAGVMRLFQGRGSESLAAGAARGTVNRLLDLSARCSAEVHRRRAARRWMRDSAGARWARRCTTW